ncbi:NAD-dependent deacylase [Paenibacillus dendritiformis]|uniref:NAD-dependent deacylase n=1 Tax=Paenibacillus dendritiformis TaxID=130049 RepID=UPI000DA9DDDE|nr:NAD-dependent deacylase [Paenibacillus dendritiformis]PZM63072.1 NAD-dependent protein deacylase [Paenibacillus dendritiformis]
MLAKWLNESASTVVFSGAGMSTESGLQDFRSADRGMWNDRDPAALASLDAMEENHDEFARFYRWRIGEMLKHGPNPGHRILADWERRGVIHGVITQNVENYHEQAGTSAIAKLHGDLGTLRCMTCHAQYPCTEYVEPKRLTRCVKNGCGGRVRPNIVLFGEWLPERELARADAMLDGVELLLVLGSSLQVSPANQFPRLAKERGARLVIVNREPTPADGAADLIIRHSIGEVLRWTDAQLARLPHE